MPRARLYLEREPCRCPAQAWPATAGTEWLLIEASKSWRASRLPWNRTEERFLQASSFGDISPSASEAQHQVTTDLPDELIFRICVKYSNKKYFFFSEVRIS